MTPDPGATSVATSAVQADDVDPYEADVVIVGGGPTGLMLACELRLAGADPVVLERLPEISQIPKGNGLVGQIVPMLDYRGLLERFSAQSTFAGPVPRFAFGPLKLDFSRLGVSPLHILAVPQRRLEELLGQRLAELGGAVRRGHELVALAQDEDTVTLDVRGPDGGYRLRAGYLVGCDGAHSLVRKQAGIGFPGVTSSDISRVGRVVLPTAKLIRRGTEVKVPGIGRLKLMTQVRTPAGVYSLGRMAALDKNAPAGAYIVYTNEDGTNEDGDTAAEAGRSAPMTLDELRASARRVIGGDLPMTEPQLLTRLVGNSRQADRYRAGRILLAGDAAHVFGAGAGLNAGLLDAVNLGWKLAAAAQDRAPFGLLDTYHAERHLAGQRAITYTRAQKALTAIGPGGKGGPAQGGAGQMSAEGAAALRELFGEVLNHPDPLGQVSELLRQPEQLRAVGELMEGSDVRYPMPTAAVGGAQPHPLVGKLAPDLRLETRDGSTRVAELMRSARCVLLDLTGGAAVADAASDWASPERGRWQLSVVTARCLTKPAPAAALLIRPDGYIAWAAAPDAPDPAVGLHEALRTWLGTPPPPEHDHDAPTP